MKDKAKWIVVIIIVILTILLIAYYQLRVLNTAHVLGLDRVEESKLNSSIENIEASTIIRQRFQAKHNNMDSITITFKDAINTKSGRLIISLKDTKNHKIVKEETIDYIRNDRGNARRYSAIGMDSKYHFEFEKQKKSKNKNYELSIQFLELENDKHNIESNEQLIGIRYSKENIHQKGKLYVNEKKIEGSIAINEEYYSNSRMLFFNIAAIGISVLIIGVSIFILTRKEITPEKIFLYTVPILCLLFIIYFPIFTGHDEQRHWLRAYEISEGHILTEIKDGKVGTSLPKSVIDGVQGLNFEQITYKDILKAL